MFPAPHSFFVAAVNARVRADDPFLNGRGRESGSTGLGGKDGYLASLEGSAIRIGLRGEDVIPACAGELDGLARSLGVSDNLWLFRSRAALSSGKESVGWGARRYQLNH